MKMHFIGGAVGEAIKTKSGKKYDYITVVATGIDYRINKETGLVEVAPYWRKEPRLYVTEE